MLQLFELPIIKLTFLLVISFLIRALTAAALLHTNAIVFALHFEVLYYFMRKQINK